MSDLAVFIKDLHHTSKFILMGTATVMGQTVEAALVKNLYKQNVVWGMFSVDNRKGKFVGKLANNANTEGVIFHYPRTIPMEWSRPVSQTEVDFNKRWLEHARTL